MAREAGVAERTVYRHYPTREALFDGLQEHVTRLVGRRRGTDAVASLEDLLTSAKDAFGVIDDLGPAYRAAQMTAAGRRAHDRNNRGERKREITAALADATDELDLESATRLRALAHVLASSSSMFLMQDVWDLSAHDVSEAVAWAINALVKQAEHDARAGRKISYDGDA